MEFKINRLKIDVNNQLEEGTRSDKIHENDDDSIVKNNKKQSNGKDNKNNYPKKDYITVNCYKYKNETVNVVAEKQEIYYEEEMKGNKLNIQK